MKSIRVYIGDSVYAEFDGLSIRLTTENDAMGPSNTIVLEPEVMLALADFYNRVTREGEKVEG